AGSEPGKAVESLVEQGQISQEQITQVTEDLELMELLETVGDESAPMEVRTAEEDPGKRIGRYTLTDQLGAGGMGVVWKAWDSQLSRFVALKLLKVQDPKLIRRFMREATLLAKLAHPNITRVYEVGVHEGKPFLVMEMVDGEPPKAENITRQEAARIIRDAARAVQSAHDEKIIHRDLKPSNLLVSKKGRVFVTDFGLARMKEEAGGLTQSGALLGTPSYMAPEQAQGKDADHRTDIYGLGATLYALVEGQPPYTGELVHEVVKRVAISNPPSISGTDDLVVVAQKAMERDREDRYQTAGELADELQRFVDDEPIVARKITPVERIWRRAKRKPALASAIALGTLVVTGLLVWSGLFVADYLQTRAQIAAASAPLAKGESAIKALREMYGSQNVNPTWEAQALANLEANADEALSKAPNYSIANYQKGMVSFWRQDFETAIEWFDKALVDDPNFHEARSRRVGALTPTIPLPEAVQDYSGFKIIPPILDESDKQALEVVEQDVALLPDGFDRKELGAAVVASSRGEFASGAENMEVYLQNNLYDKTNRRLFAWLLFGDGQFEKAGENADLLLSVNDQDTDAWFLRAYAYAGVGDFDNALTAMRNSLSIKEDLNSRNWLAFWLFKQERLDQSLDEYSAILQQDPDFLEALRGRSSLLGLIRTPDSLVVAAQDAQRAIELAPDDAYGHFLLGQAFLTTDQVAAIASHEKAIQLEPDYFAHSTAAIANAHILLGQYDQAIEKLNAALEVEPDQYNWRWQLANVHRSLGDTSSAIAALEPLDNDVPLLLFKADLRRQAGDFSTAKVNIQDALELEPDNTLAQAKLVEYLARDGDLDTAQQLAASVLSENDDESIWFQITDSWFQADQLDKATTAGKRFVQKFPNSVQSNYLLANILAYQQGFVDAYP
ncbi:MAG: protein kinase, partial [Pseudomonadota bacterium]